jgi:hypothetical protein
MIIDSQAVKNTCNASVDSKGFCFYKSTNGIKRHLAVDTLGFPFFTHCTRSPGHERLRNHPGSQTSASLIQALKDLKWVL